MVVETLGRGLRVGVIPMDGNISSVLRGFQAEIVKHPDNVVDFSHIILPGVGSFNQIVLLDPWREVLISHCVSGKPILGICLGMQLLGDSSEEGEGKGLKLISGRSIKLPKIRMGWDIVNGLGEVYFCHQYEFRPKNYDHVFFKTEDGIIAGIKSKNVIGVQFHPEKSQTVGKKFISWFLNVKKEINCEA